MNVSLRLGLHNRVDSHGDHNSSTFTALIVTARIPGARMGRSDWSHKVEYRCVSNSVCMVYM